MYDKVFGIKWRTKNIDCATCVYTYTVYVGMGNGRKSSFSYHFCMTKLLVFSRGLKILTEVCVCTRRELFVLNRVHYTSAYTYCIVTIFSLPRNKKKLSYKSRTQTKTFNHSPYSRTLYGVICVYISHALFSILYSVQTNLLYKNLREVKVSVHSLYPSIVYAYIHIPHIDYFQYSSQ